MAEPTKEKDAKYGEKMIEVKVRFLQTPLPKWKGKLNQGILGLRVMVAKSAYLSFRVIHLVCLLRWRRRHQPFHQDNAVLPLAMNGL